VREIDDLGRLVNQDEAERDQAVRTALRNPNDSEKNDIIDRQHSFFVSLIIVW